MNCNRAKTVWQQTNWYRLFCYGFIETLNIFGWISGFCCCCCRRLSLSSIVFSWRTFNPLDSFILCFVFFCSNKVLSSMKITNFHVLIWMDEQWKWSKRGGPLDISLRVHECDFFFLIVYFHVAYVCSSSIYPVAVLFFYSFHYACPLLLINIVVYFVVYQFDCVCVFFVSFAILK